jgi:hypothetical protein
MKSKIDKYLRHAWSNERGQALPWLVFALVGLLFITGVVTDVGRAYVAYNQLQASTNAAALAAASVTYNTSGATVQSQAGTFGSGSGGKNTIGGIGTVNTTANAVCLNILLPPSTNCTKSFVLNAVSVQQTASVPTYFLRMLGVSSIPIGTAAQAAMQGVAQQWNVAIIIDSTQSMSSAPDSNCSGFSTRFSCALGGIQAFLGATNPCAPGYTSCVSSNANVHVSLFSFPNVSTTNVADDYNCGGTPTNEPYTFPSATATSYTSITYTPTRGSGGWTATYQVLPGLTGNTDADGYLSDYYSSGASNHLNTNSEIVKAITGCMKNPGGEGTFLAGAIYAAQATLLAEQKLNSNSKNAIIVLSDGEPQTTSMEPGIALTGNGLYPDTNDECQQAIKAANDAAYAGTRVYAVAYGSTSSGCTLDRSVLHSVTYNAPLNVALTSITPCVTMEDIASSLQYFYADSTSASSSCTDSAHSTTSLQDIYLSIAASITNPQLLPRNAK